MSLRSWATPLTIGAFLLMAVTGGMMFFHLETPLGKVAHEWLGWALVVAVGAHVWLNRRAFSTYFKRSAALGIMGGAVIVLAATFVVPLGDSESVPVRQVLGSLTHAPISTLAVLAGRQEAELLSALSVTHPGVTADQTLTDLAGASPEAAVGLLAQVYGQALAE